MNLSSSKSENGPSLHVGLIGPLPPPFGGMANQTRQLWTLLESEGVQVSTAQTNAAYRPKIVEKIRGVRAFFRIIPYLLKLWMLAGKVDVIHVMANSGWSWHLFSAPAVWIGWLRKTPVIINYRGGEAQSYFSRAIRWVRPTMERANAVIVPSGYLKKVFLDFDFGSEIIPNIINLDRFRPKDTEMPSLSAPHLVVTRNLEPIYGISTAIKAVSILRESWPNIRLSVAGSGPQKRELEDLVTELNLEGVVIFTGRLNPDEVVVLYHDADIMLNPTTVDNMPNSVLESLACGVPVVTTNVGGVPYIVEHEKSALMVEVGDAEEMAKQVGRLLADPTLYSNLVSAGLEEATQYAWPAVKGKWTSLYRRLQVVQ